MTGSKTTMRVLVMTNIFPNALDPSNAAYNRRQLGELGKLCEVEVLALVPWFPGARLAGDRLRAGRLASLPTRWSVDGLPVEHPRVLYVPRIGRRWSGALYAASLLPHVWRRRRRIDVLIGCFGYPDGWAAVALGKLLGLPAIVKVHGSDVNVIGAGPLEPEVRWALREAQAVVGPSRPLIDRAIELGANPERARVIPNGVDRAVFRPGDRLAARRALGLPETGLQILFVGRVEPEKGCDELVAALPELRASEPVRLVMIGDGVSRAGYERLAAERDLPLRCVGPKPHAEIAEWLAASDVLALPSWAEGTPNVILEALACGRPVVATRVGGIPDVLVDRALGELCAPRDSDDLRGALERVLSRGHDADAIVRKAGLGGWAESARSLFEVLHRATQRDAAPPETRSSRTAA